ncbi:MAG TPA: PilZ domain-containing protein, partial [Geobacteraceae bacterium]|nr:PilZ domain-containing protein [Geobacteraceae bacterium]
MDQREYPRISLQAEALLSNDKGDFRGMLANLSLGGIYIRTDSAIAVGEAAEVSFRHDIANGNAAIKACGSVVRNDGEGIAFRLRRMDVDSFIQLRTLLA